MTLIEILITAVIVTICGLSILASIKTVILFQQSIREENGATRAAVDMLDLSRKELFFRLESWEQEVVVDDRGTLSTADDVMGVATVRYYAPNAAGFYFSEMGHYLNEVGTPDNPLPMDLTMVIAEATVRWNPAGSGRTREREVALSVLLAP